ncbi:HesA/MoeB/ThiF family protein [Enterococcus sp. AD013-P3]|uniref:HesA/MoeB/ThiF family protein n=1 Tax=Enterococcus sp. AD013-P3 TaxID=3411036 RepID=UPI003B924439
MNRYDRQIRVSKIGLTGQQKLHNSRLLLVGCGALGTYAAEQLVRGGVGELILVDPDTVDLTNLQRQTLFTVADVQAKRHKVTACAEALSAIDPAIKVTPLAMTFDQALFQELGKLDLVLDCTDNFLVRTSINSFCLEKNLPFIFAACGGTSGQVMALQPAYGPCLQCVFPQMAELTEKSCETIGVITPLIPLVSALQVGLAYRCLLEPEKMDWQTLLVTDVWSGELQRFKIRKKEECPSCGKKTDLQIKRPLKKVCGHIYQGQLAAPVSLSELAAISTAAGWPCRQNKLALLIQLHSKTSTERQLVQENEGHSQDTQTADSESHAVKEEKLPSITIFRNGRALFYDFPDEAFASQLYELLQSPPQSLF